MEDSSTLVFESQVETESVRRVATQKSIRRQEQKELKNNRRTEKLRTRHPLPLKPKTEKQVEYLDSMRTRNQVFAIGGAGTGKTYVASRFAIQELFAKNYKRIVITRPTVSRPEHRLGFLPGDGKAKMDPWLVPIISAMKEQANPREIQELLKSETIEFVPFEHMRGRTFKDAFVILDEAQNCTLADLKLFLTRIGEDSTVVVSGDTDQVDINNSGLSTVIDMVRRFSMNADVVEFAPEDVIRSAIAKEWVAAFARLV